MLKKGKKPIGDIKTSNAVIDPDEIFTNALSISPELKKELDDQGLVGRFVDYKKLKEMDGVHHRNWQVYKRKNSDIMDNHEFQLGSGPDGLIRRGSCVLAVKSKEAVAKHQQYLKQKADRQKASYNKKAAEELRRLARDARLNTNIVEGYGEDGDE